MRRNAYQAIAVVLALIQVAGVAQAAPPRVRYKAFKQYSGRHVPPLQAVSGNQTACWIEADGLHGLTPKGRTRFVADVQYGRFGSFAAPVTEAPDGTLWLREAASTGFDTDYLHLSAF